MSKHEDIELVQELLDDVNGRMRRLHGLPVRDLSCEQSSLKSVIADVVSCSIIPERQRPMVEVLLLRAFNANRSAEAQRDARVRSRNEQHFDEKVRDRSTGGPLLDGGAE